LSWKVFEYKPLAGGDEGDGSGAASGGGAAGLALLPRSGLARRPLPVAS